VSLRYAGIKRVALTRTVASIAVAALLVMPPGAAAKQGTSQLDKAAAQQCAQERHAIGRRAFDRKYGTKRRMRACIRRNRVRVRSALQAAGSSCQEELSEMGLAAFIDEYGDEPTDPLSLAFDECVAEGIDEILDPGYGSDDDISGDDLV
jgi:hypothetical protein